MKKQKSKFKKGQKICAKHKIHYIMGQISSDCIGKNEEVVVEKTFIDSRGRDCMWLTTHADRYGPYYAEDFYSSDIKRIKRVAIQPENSGGLKIVRQQQKIIDLLEGPDFVMIDYFDLETACEKISDNEKLDGEEVLVGAKTFVTIGEMVFETK